MTGIQLIEALENRGIKHQLADNGAILCEFPGLPYYGLGISILGPWLDCYAYETYAGTGLGDAGHKTLESAIAWALLLITSCEARLSAELALHHREV